MERISWSQYIKLLIEALKDYFKKVPDNPTPPTPTPNPPPTPTPEPPPAPTPDIKDDLDLSRVKNIIVKNTPGVTSDMVKKAKVTGKYYEARVDGKYIRSSFHYVWPSNNNTGKPCDAVCCFFYERGGEVVGGKFDHWRNGGQIVKELENVSGGYGGHSMPAKDTPAWAMIFSYDGTQRSNTCKVTWV